MQASVLFSLLKKTKVEILYIESKWIVSLKKFLAKIDGKLILDWEAPMKIQEKHGKFLMETFLQLGRFQRAQLKKINYCGLYLKVSLVSDTSTAEGTHLDVSLIKGDHHIFSSKSQNIPVHQVLPSKTLWALWYKALRLISTRQGKLFTPLGEWLYPLTELYHQKSFEILQYKKHMDGADIICLLSA